MTNCSMRGNNDLASRLVFKGYRVTKQYDLIVIGGGSGGLAHAQRATEYGASVMVVESARLGGTCVNVGCVPKKVMWYAANLAHDQHIAAGYGFDLPQVPHHWSRLRENRDAYVERLNGIYANNLHNKDIDVVEGRARFVDANTIAVGEAHYRAKTIVIATGGAPSWPDIPGAELGITSDGFFELDVLPKKVAIVGSGYVSVELGGVLAALGAEVSILTRFDGVLRSFDQMLRDEVTQALAQDGIALEQDFKPASLMRGDDGLLTLSAKDGRACDGLDAVIWAIGRKPETVDLALANAGVNTDKDGFVPVDEWQATNASGVFALGDVTGAVALTPVAIAAGRRLADRLFGGMTDRRLEYRDIATVIFSHPPMATMGLTEAQARTEYGDDVEVFNSAFVPMRYALGTEKRRAAMKLVTVGASQRIVGCHVFGEGADEMMQGFAVAIRMGATKQHFDDTVAIHPTSAEELVTMR